MRTVPKRMKAQVNELTGYGNREGDKRGTGNVTNNAKFFTIHVSVPEFFSTILDRSII